MITREETSTRRTIGYVGKSLLELEVRGQTQLSESYDPAYPNAVGKVVQRERTPSYSSGRYKWSDWYDTRIAFAEKILLITGKEFDHHNGGRYPIIVLSQAETEERLILVARISFAYSINRDLQERQRQLLVLVLYIDQGSATERVLAETA